MDKYAIIKTGGKQYKVAENDVIYIELLKDVEGGTVEFPEVLFCHDGEKPRVGLPHVEGCSVKGEILGEAKGPKVYPFKYKKRKNQRIKKGHRQRYQEVRITEIAAA